MPIAVSILMLLLLGAVVMVALLFFAKILCEGTAGMMAMATEQSKQRERNSSKIAKRYSKKVTKVETQIEDILKRQHF
jgi:membrane-anchored protein YejM (alkaline phosphatase superfamily)